MMNIPKTHAYAGRAGATTTLTLALLVSHATAGAQTLTFAQAPLFLVSSVKPNVLVVYDNSQSMDGTMAGKLIAGSDPATRGNIARAVLTSTITSYRSTFNWGLESFGLNGSPSYYYTYGYFFGSDTQVVFTNDCVGGVSASNGGLRCMANPETGNGFSYITFALSGDDPAINDVLYIGASYGPQMYGIGVYGSTSYNVYRNHGTNTAWSAGSFSNGVGTWGFTPTDAGYLPQTPPNSRMVWIARAWGYNNNITGYGRINQPVAADSTAQYNALTALLAAETSTASSAELKNAAVYTPLAGSLVTAKQYFSNTLGGTSTPVTQTCQKNFVLLATDGNPTGMTDGNLYPTAQQQNTYNSSTNTWTFGQAANDVFTNTTALRTTTIGNQPSVNGTYDVETYVVGLGDSVANAGSIAVLNKIAQLGGGNSTAYLANNATALSDAFQQISTDIVSKTSAASAVSLNSGSWNTGSEVFQARFSSGDWSGQLLAYALTSGGSLRTPALWDSGQLVNGQNWNTGRQILSYKPSAALGLRGVAFRWPAIPTAPTATEIDAGMATALNTSASNAVDGYGSQRLAYLRGNTALEARNCSTCGAPVFRDRPTSVLGDIVNSAPAYVGGPTGNFRDTIEAVPYSSYASTRTAVTPTIFVGANDGMLHAINARNGSELFAYLPWAVRNRVSALTDNSYGHQYTVDGSPTVGDAFYSGAWHTMLVSGMNAGATGLFGLDVTDPSYYNETNARRVVRWEIDGTDGDIGYVFSQPVVAKMRNGRWMAIVGNGYNSTNGHAVLLLIDVETGAVTKVDTLAGSAAARNGLSGVVAISSANNGVADIVYAGDLAGNLWRFDLASVASSGWKVAYGTTAAPQPLFRTAASQPITARPDVTVAPQGGYLVTFGTGRYVDASDNTPSATQTLYGIRDGGSTVVVANLQQQTVFGTQTSGANTFRITTHAVGSAADGALPGDNAISQASFDSTKSGWYMNLPSSGERIVAQATVRFGKVVVSTLVPDTNPCSYGGDGWIMEVDVTTGNRSSTSLDTNGDNVVDSADRVTVTSVTTGAKVTSGVRVGSIPAAPSIIRAQNRAFDDKLVNTTAGNVLRVRETGNVLPSSRAAWEQVK